MTYRGYWTVYDEQGKRLGAQRLGRLSKTLTSHIQARAIDVGSTASRYSAVDTATHIGTPVIRMQAGSAPEARAIVRVVRSYFDLMGWRSREDLTSATRRAL
jgi:hypothetical protein